ncbi:MAG: GspE/PulE family protein [Candidatus Glassbacteria bacterium]|nr:GspE/PulE family protein [Candidatus Glassbacteria bacterium]
MAKATAETKKNGPTAADEKQVLNNLLKMLVSKRQISEKDLDTVLEITIQKLVELVKAQAITIYSVGKDGLIHFTNVYFSELLYKDNEELHEAFQKKADRLRKITLKKGQGIVGKVIESAETYISFDTQNDPNFYSGVDEETGFQTKSMITVPVITDQVIGCIQIINKNPPDGPGLFTEKDRQLLEEVADYSAKIIQKVHQPEVKMTDTELAYYLARLTDHEYYEIRDDYVADEKLMNLVGENNLKKFLILPIKKTGSQAVEIAISNPVDFERIDNFRWATKLGVDKIVVSAESQIKRIIEEYFKNDSTGIDEVAALVGDTYGSGTDGVESVELEDDVDEESTPIVQLANRIIEDAYTRGASDIHIEPFEKEILVRYRIDGVCQIALKLPPNSMKALISRLKIMSGLNIAERRLPQDGRIVFKEFTRTGIDIDLRVATGPMVYGEKVVMRILDKTSTSVSLDMMGYSKHNLAIYEKIVKSPYGMILHVGPTGSGKTTTLYAALNYINDPGINIQTAEDPVEYMLFGINQMPVRKEIGLTFASALRCYLRQDPDVILVGEIRDLETAEIAIEASLTGHLLFSTLHTNDAAGTVTRFLDMGIQPFLVSSSLLCVCAQRLLRRLCPKCKEAYEPSEQELEVLGTLAEGATLFKAKGCDACHGSGYKGRIGTHEVLTMSEEIKEAILRKPSSEEIKEEAIKAGMITIYLDSLEKAAKGITSIEEVLRVVRAE